MALELKTALLALEDFLANDEPAWDRIGALAGPDELGHLFLVQLASLIRRGPAAASVHRALTPSLLLLRASQAAGRGLVPMDIPGALRATLQGLAEEVRSARAWARDEPLWWEPLPPSDALEERWAALTSPPLPEEEPAAEHAGRPLRLPSPEQMRQAFDDGSAPRWLALETLLAAGWLAELSAELESAHAAGQLPLQRAGVGEKAKTSDRRSDEVLYLSGTEPELLSVAPRLAALVQALLGPAARRLARSLNRPSEPRRLWAPQRAMLARYPAPSAGYHPHLDNPGGVSDNGRALTFILYLNHPESQLDGGEIAVWPAGSPVTSEPALVLPPTGGSGLLFDSRTVPHQVRPLRGGSARWALSLWFQERPEGPEAAPPPAPNLRANDVLLPISEPVLPPESLLLHDLERPSPFGRVLVLRTSGAPEPRVGLVSTVYRAGEGLIAWCQHHFDLGIGHILLVFDHLEDPPERELASALEQRYPPARLTLWSGTHVAKEHWSPLLSDPEMLELFSVARSGGSSWAIAARQTLNATAALLAARTDALGGAPLDWLLHLDADELMSCAGAGRGGEDLRAHFAAVTRAQVRRIRYLNHELLREPSGPEPRRPQRFKVNPGLAVARLGRAGWRTLVRHLGMAPKDPRPYFLGYTNGKSAVAVKAARSAGGVHGWNLIRPVAAEADLSVAGPAVLHFHPPDAEAWVVKNLSRASAPPLDQPAPFSLSPVEELARGKVQRLHAAGEDEESVARHLRELYEHLIHFRPEEIELLEEAGLLTAPGIEWTVGD